MHKRISGFGIIEKYKLIKDDMRKNILLLIIAFCGLAACGGGGGGSTGSTPPGPPPAPVNLVPLKIALLDLNDNPVPYADISKIGSHAIYKLRFTNVNSINIYVGFDAPEYIVYAQAQKMGIPVESYIANYLPAGQQYGEAIKTTNIDDCFNYMESGASTMTLKSGATCSYYTYFANIGNNYSQNNTFTVPVSYTILGHDVQARLDVVQCVRNGAPPNPVTYDCSNMSKPGFSEQFITYKALPINGTSNFYPFNLYGHMITEDGNWYWNCTTGSCKKYSLSYDSIANRLMQSATFTTIPIYDSGEAITEIYPSLDGSNVWVSSYDNADGFVLANTNFPNILFTSECYGGHCVPNIDTSMFFNNFANGTIGLDGSFWWNTEVKADIYDKVAKTFSSTNIDAVVGVNADGTIIGFNNGQASCFDHGPNYTSYVYRGPLLNYAPTEIGTHAQNYGQNVYMYMYINGVFNYSGIGVVPKAYYKVHTENGKCEINLDDYTFNLGASNKYHLAGQKSESDPFLVTSSSNMYSGL